MINSPVNWHYPGRFLGYGSRAHTRVFTML